MSNKLSAFEKKWPFVVFISYPLDKYEWGSIDGGITKIAKKFKGQNDGAGTGFGFRDVDCSFHNKEDASKFRRAVKRTYTNVKTSIMERTPINDIS